MSNELTVRQDIEGDDLALAEAHIRQVEPDIQAARNAVRAWLLSECGQDRPSGSIADAAATLAEAVVGTTSHAAVPIRFLAVPGLIPTTNEGNQLARSIVALAEARLPVLCNLLKFNAKQQTYEKYRSLEEAHQLIRSLLNPLLANYGDLDALLNARRLMSGALSHSAVRQYCEVFRLNEVRAIVEAVFSKLKRVAAAEVTLLADCEDCMATLARAKNTAPELGSFLALDFLLPFIENTERTLTDHLAAVSTRLSATISLVSETSSVTLVKRYPLAELNRSLMFDLPLKNSGPGLATDVRVDVTSEDASIYVADYQIQLGNVLPGAFSVTVDALVIAPVERLAGCIEISWGVIGSAERRHDIFAFTVIAQKSDIAWTKLEYWTPYSTDVAEGEQFLGRSERLRFVASKMLRSPMEPFYITGQRRVGKTSLIKAAPLFAQDKLASGELVFCYILWGSVQHANPQDSMHELGKTIEGFISDHLPRSIDLQSGDYRESLSGLVRLAEKAGVAAPNKRFAIIIDELDEIPPELYLQGKDLYKYNRIGFLCGIPVGAWAS